MAPPSVTMMCWGAYDTGSHRSVNRLDEERALTDLEFMENLRESDYGNAAARISTVVGLLAQARGPHRTPGIHCYAASKWL
jgi:hypothetical protein